MIKPTRMIRLSRLLQELEGAFPSFVIDVREEQITRRTKVSVFNANMFSNTLDPQLEEYYLDEYVWIPDLIAKIKKDFYEK